MWRQIETERLELKLLDKKGAGQVLDFLLENRDMIEKYEAKKQPLYYTKFYQESLIQTEYDAALKKAYLRYYIFEKNREEVIGTVSVGQLRPYPYNSGVLGYKMAGRYMGRGYATEAVASMCEAAFGYLGLHRLEAYVLDENIPSIRVLDKNGFKKEGLCQKNLCVNGQWRDHFLFGKIK